MVTNKTLTWWLHSSTSFSSSFSTVQENQVDLAPPRSPVHIYLLPSLLLLVLCWRALLLVVDNAFVIELRYSHKPWLKTCDDIKHVWFVVTLRRKKTDLRQLGLSFMTTVHLTSEIIGATTNRESSLMILFWHQKLVCQVKSLEKLFGVRLV